MNWIDIKNKKPQKDQEVIVAQKHRGFNYSYSHACYVVNDYKTGFVEHYYGQDMTSYCDNVTHWAELTPPVK